jgi:low temperature requirement protein LtrA
MTSSTDRRDDSGLVRAPRFFDQASERPSALELFFDLVFVFCVSTLTRYVHEDPTWTSAGAMLLLFVPVWWTWTNVMFCTNRFPTDDVVERVLVLLAAASSAVMGFALLDVPGHGADIFALGYAAGRLIVAALYWRAGRAVAHAAIHSRWMVLGSCTSAVLWLVSLLLPWPIQVMLWTVATIIDVATPAALGRRRGLLPVDVDHMPERTSAFVVIALGESLLSTFTAALDEGVARPGAVAAIAVSFLLTAALWWGFFDWRAMQARHHSLHGDRGGRMANIVYSYLHFPVVAAIAFVAVGMRLTQDHPEGPIGDAAAWALSLGAAGYLLAINSITLALRVPRAQSIGWVRLVLAVGLVVAASVGRSWPAPVYLAVVAAVLVAHVAANLNRARAHGAPTSARRP